MEHSEKIETFAAAFVAAQGQIKGAVKDATNPHYKSHYADLASVMDACKEALNSNGISVLQTPSPSDPGTLAIDTVLMHKSGEWVSGKTIMPLGNKNDPQAFGSALTYARRYSLAAMVGVCPEDDDAEGATHRGPPQRQSQPARQAPPVKSDPPRADAEAAETHLDDLLYERGLDASGVTAAKAWVIKSKKLNRLGELSAKNWDSFYEAVGKGTFDKFKTNGAPVGAGSK